MMTPEMHLGYQIEKKMAGGEWMKASPTLAPGTTQTVMNLVEGKQYEFRVKAVNDAGPGEPSKATKPHIVQDPICKNILLNTPA